ncbi:MAG: alanine--tRNA ligase, partial [Chloroflexi bacterium]|nr:alanine--tRNA ligase [Chloroflexota bacterium]
EQRFGETLETGVELLDQIIARQVDAQESGGSSPLLAGRDVFKLYDTYGFPPDITRDIAREHGLQVDLEGFEREMEAQRERGRASAKFGLSDAASPEAYQTLATGESRFTGYDSLREETVVIGLLAGGAPVERASKGQQVEVVLRETPFYAEAGGQVGDTGQLRGPLGVVRITETHSPIQGLIAHAGEVTDGEIAVGESVEAAVDATRRDDVVRNHTGTHLLNAALRKVLGPHVRQAGSLVAPDRLRFDFSHPSAVTPAELQEIQALVNDTIMANLSVTHATMPYKEAVDQGALAFFGEKYGDTVRTCRIARRPDSQRGRPRPESGRSENGDDELFSFELCAGTHARATGEIGLLHVESEGSIAAGTRRIEAVTGRGADGALTQRHVLLESLAQQLQTSPAELTRRVASLLEDLDQERKRASSMERDLARRQAEALPAQAQTINGVTVLTAQVSAASPDALREMAGWLKERLGSAVIVLGADVNGKPSFVAMVTDDLTPKGYHAGNIVREVAKVADGGGGGRAEVAHAGGKDASKLQQALELVPRLVEQEQGS